MLRYWRSSADPLFALLVALAIAGTPAMARREPAAADPNGPDKVMSRKAMVEQIKARVDPSMQIIRGCVATAPPGEARTSLETDLGPLEAQAKDALRTYDVGNYDEAIRRYTVLERNARTTQLVCDKLRQSVERCARSVTGALERIRSWGVKIARIQEPAQRAMCENIFVEAEKGLVSLEKTCATTDPAWVARQIPLVIKPLDEALKKAK